MVGKGVTDYLDMILKRSVKLIYKDANNFFKMVKAISLYVTIPFLVVYTILYLLIFIHFIENLKDEIGQIQEIIKLIPQSIIEGNIKIRQQVYISKGMH